MSGGSGGGGEGVLGRAERHTKRALTRCELFPAYRVVPPAKCVRLRSAPKLPALEFLEMSGEALQAREVVHREEVIDERQRRLHAARERLVLR